PVQPPAPVEPPDALRAAAADWYPDVTDDELRTLLRRYVRGAMRLVTPLRIADVVGRVDDGRYADQVDGVPAILDGPIPARRTEPGHVSIIWRDHVRNWATVDLGTDRPARADDAAGVLAQAGANRLRALLAAATGYAQDHRQRAVPVAMLAPFTHRPSVADIAEIVVNPADVGDPRLAALLVWLTGHPEGSSIRIGYPGRQADLPSRPPGAIADDPNRLTGPQARSLAAAGRYARWTEPDGDSWFSSVIAAARDVDDPPDEVGLVAGMTPVELRQYLATQLDASPGIAARLRALGPEQYYRLRAALLTPGEWVPGLIELAPELLGVRVLEYGPDGPDRPAEPVDLHLVRTARHYLPALRARRTAQTPAGLEAGTVERLAAADLDLSNSMAAALASAPAAASVGTGVAWVMAVLDRLGVPRAVDDGSDPDDARALANRFHGSFQATTVDQLYGLEPGSVTAATVETGIGLPWSVLLERRGDGTVTLVGPPRGDGPGIVTFDPAAPPPEVPADGLRLIVDRLTGHLAQVDSSGVLMGAGPATELPVSPEASVVGLPVSPSASVADRPAWPDVSDP
ncbi:MAG TPA: hypothetical protein VHA75_01100, partial [Rugosimonospora sp.]|nr:hypothetical protein [Rugosimonospora sp.]